MHRSKDELDSLARSQLAELEGKSLSMKDRGQIPVQEMPTQEPEYG